MKLNELEKLEQLLGIKILSELESFVNDQVEVEQELLELNDEELKSLSHSLMNKIDGELLFNLFKSQIMKGKE